MGAARLSFMASVLHGRFLEGFGLVMHRVEGRWGVSTEGMGRADRDVCVRLCRYSRWRR